MANAHTRRMTGSQRGMILVPLLMVSVLIAGLTVVLLEESVGEVRRVSFAEERLRALEIAEIGLLRAEMELRSEYDVDGDGLGSVTGAVGGGNFEVLAAVLDEGDRRYKLESRGAKGMAVRRLEAGVRVLPGAYFTHALFAKQSIRLNGHCWSDAYDSNTGTYGSQATNWNDLLRISVGDVGGDVGSNGSISITGSGGILGDGVPGPADVTKVNGTAFVTGSTTPRSEDRELPNPQYEAFLAAFNGNANLSIDTSDPNVSYDKGKLELKTKSGAGVRLEGGTYIFHTLDISGSGDLTVAGPSVIYITDKFEMGGGSVRVLSGKSLDCIVYGHAYDFPAGARHQSQSVRLGSKSESTMALYAPTFSYTSHGGGDLFGSVVADTIVLSGGAGLHFDRALTTIRRRTGGSERLYWKAR